jgi:hypothetical protein
MDIVVAGYADVTRVGVVGPPSAAQRGWFRVAAVVRPDDRFHLGADSPACDRLGDVALVRIRPDRLESRRSDSPSMNEGGGHSRHSRSLRQV